MALNAIPPIPPDQLERIQPLVSELLMKLHALLDRLPPTTESALSFALEAEDRQ